MAQSDDFKRFGLISGLNTDDAPEDVARAGDYLDALNLRNTGSKGSEAGYNSNIESMIALSGSLLPGLNNIIGGGRFDDTGQILGFRYNSGGQCQMILYDFKTAVYAVIYTDVTDSGGATLLPLNPQKTVLAILINKLYAIWWAEDLEVGYCNLQTLAAGGYGPTVLWEDLSLLKPQCIVPPTGTYGSDPGQPANYLYGLLPQFTVQYINADFNKSAWSTRSARIVPYQQNTPVLGQNVGQNNYIIVSVNLGSIRNVVTNIACQFDDTGRFSIIKSVNNADALLLPNTTVDVATEINEAYDPATNTYSFAWYNNTISIPVTATETDLSYDYIWPANAGAQLNGNIAALAAWKTLYPRPSISVTIAAIGYDPNIDIPAGHFPDPLTAGKSFPGATGSGAGDHKRKMYIDLSGTPHTGDVVVIIQADIRNATNIQNNSYTVPLAQDGNLLAVVTSISEVLQGSISTDGINYRINWTGHPYFGLQTFSVELFYAGAVVANSIPAYLDNTRYQFAFGIIDYKMRYFPLATDNSYIVATSSYAQQQGNATKITVTINDAVAPANAFQGQILTTRPPVTKIIDTIATLLVYKGGWDAKTNTPTLAVNQGNIGDTYQITTPEAPTDPSSYHNLGTNADYKTGDYITNVGGTTGGAGIGQYYEVLPRNFGNLAGTGNDGILVFSINSLRLLNAQYNQDNVTTNLVYDFAEGDRCTLHYWIASIGAVDTISIIAHGTGYTPGTYAGVALTGGTGTGAIGTVTVDSGGFVTTVVITTPGTGYSIGDVLTGTVTGGTGWELSILSLVTNGNNFFNLPCIDLAVLGYDVATGLVKVENSAALTFTNGHTYYNGFQIDQRNIFLRLYSPQKQVQAASVAINGTVWYEVGERITITDGLWDTLNFDLLDGGVYYKTRQFPDGILPYTNAPISVLATDLNYSDFYFSDYHSFGRARTYNDEKVQTEQAASIITSQPYILGSENNGLTRFYPANIYGDGDGQTSSSKGRIQIMWPRGQQLVTIQQLGTFYIPVNEAYTVLNEQLTGQSISEKLLNNGRYDPEGVGLGLTKCFCTRYSNGYGVDPNKSLPYEWTLSGIQPISGKSTKYFKGILQLADSQGKKLQMFYNDYYEEVMLCIQAEGGILILFPFKEGIWNPFNSYDIAGTDVSATPNGAHCTASYNSSTGIVTYTPTTDYVGPDTATFTFDPGTGPVTLNNCLLWIAGTTTVNPFFFTSLTGISLSTVTESINSITVSGPDIAVPISISGASGQYAINGGAYTSSPGTVISGDTVQIRQTSSGSNSTTTTTTLTVGATAGTFAITTLPAAAGHYNVQSQYNVNVTGLSNGTCTGTPAGLNALTLTNGQQAFAAYTAIVAGTVHITYAGAAGFPGHTYFQLSVGGVIEDTVLVDNSGSQYLTFSTSPSSPTDIVVSVITA